MRAARLEGVLGPTAKHRRFNSNEFELPYVANGYLERNSDFYDFYDFTIFTILLVFSTIFRFLAYFLRASAPLAI